MDDLPLKPVESGYRTVLRLQALVVVLPVMIALVIGDIVQWALVGLPVGIVTGLAVLSFLYAFAIMPARRFNRLGYAVSDDSVRVARGYLFHVDTIVPFVRVQHIDVGQGLLERWCNISHLVVHTAGTHNSIVTLPGLAPDTAHALRDTIRARIQTDFA